MKIGFDAKRLFFNRTGLGNYSRTLVRNLIKYHPENLYFLYTPKIVKNNPFFKEFSSYNNVKILPVKGIFPGISRSLFLHKQLEEKQPDVYHGLSNEIPLFSMPSKIRYAVTVHDLIFKHYPDTYPLADRMIYDFKFKRSCERADKIIAISHATKNDIVKFYQIPEEKIEVVYQSCDDVFYQPLDFNKTRIVKDKYQLPANYLLFVGSIQERKNLQLILQAYPLLKPDFQLPLVIVGKGEKFKKKLQPLIRKNNLETKLIWLDKLSDNEELKHIYTGAEMLIYPSLYEGFGLPVAEALLCKTAVITSDVSSLPEAGGPGALYISPHSKEELAAAIEKLAANENFKKELAEKGFEYAIEKFSPQTTTSHICRIYQQIV